MLSSLDSSEMSTTEVPPPSFFRLLLLSLKWMSEKVNSGLIHLGSQPWVHNYTLVGLEQEKAARCY